MSGQFERAWSAGCAAAKLLGVAAALILIFAAEPSHAVLRDSFEGPVPSWQPTGNSDVRHRLDHHARVRGSSHSGSWSERVRLTAGNGSFVHMRHAIGHAMVIDELKPSVWVNANSPGIQLLANVVLPRTVDPKSGKPMTLLLGGTVYNRAGSWQRLAVGQLPKLLERQVRVLRSQIGPHVDAREAYVDSVVLNVYGGRGTTDVMIDDLEVEGIVGRGPATPSVELSPPIASRLPMARNARGRPRFRMDGAVLRFGNQPVLVRMIEHNGEPLAWLRSLGFNAIRLESPPNADLLTEARRAGVWIVCPPPTIRNPKGGAEIGTIDNRYDGVLAWHLGSGLVGQNYPKIEQIANRLRRVDSTRRPIACQAEAGLAEYSRLADVLMLDRRPIGTSLELVDYEVWLRERQQLARAGTMFWAKIQTQLAPALEEQLRFMTEGRVQKVPVDGVQIRSLLAMALASGVRGFSFQSASRLDAKDYASRHRALTLELVNMQLELFESTVTEGGVAVHAPSSDRALSAAVLGHPRKSMRLILPIRRASGEQLISSRPQTDGVSVTVPGVPDSNQAYRVSPVGLDLLERKRRAGGLRVSLDRQTSDLPVLLTDDPLVVERLTAQLRRHSARAARVQRDLAAMRLAAFEATTKQMPKVGEGVSSHKSVIAESRKALATSDSALAGRDNKTAFLFARRASDQIGDVSRQTWQSLIHHCDSAVSMPLVMTEATLPDATRHLPRVANAPLSANLLPGGDFKDINSMMRVGWRHYRQSTVSAATSVDLVRSPGGRQGTCLVLRATPPPTDVVQRLVETPPVWVTSPPVVVAKGGLVRIEGQIYIPHAITGSVDGLLIAESIGGEALAYRTGQTDGWQHFTLYRVATKSGPITLTIALTGLGEAWIDDLTIRAVGG